MIVANSIKKKTLSSGPPTKTCRLPAVCGPSTPNFEELLEFLPERLGGLGHVEVAVLAEVEDVVVVFAGDDVGVSLPLTLQPCSWLSALWLCLRLSLLQPP